MQRNWSVLSCYHHPFESIQMHYLLDINIKVGTQNEAVDNRAKMKLKEQKISNIKNSNDQQTHQVDQDQATY